MQSTKLSAAIVLLIIAPNCGGWNLSNLGLGREDFSIEHVSVFYARAFLCVRAKTAANSKRTPMRILPTLVEVPWPEPQLPALPAVASQPRIYPSDLDHARHTDRECNGIIAARATAIALDTGDLWLLDAGSPFCAPKLIEYDLVGRNEETHRCMLTALMAEQPVASIHIGPDVMSRTAPAATSASPSPRHLYLTVSDASADFLVVYAKEERRWWKLKLMTNNGQIVVPRSLTFTATGQLYIADRSDHLWLMAPKATPPPKASKLIRRAVAATQPPTPRAISGGIRQVTVTLVGDLLGLATQLVADPAGGHLYYYLGRDGAVVRWDASKPLCAEHHDVLYFSRVPVAQIVFGYKGGVWVVGRGPESGAGQEADSDEHCHRVLSHFTGSPLNAERMLSRRQVMGIIQRPIL